MPAASGQPVRAGQPGGGGGAAGLVCKRALCGSHDSSTDQTLDPQDPEPHSACTSRSGRFSGSRLETEGRGRTEACPPPACQLAPAPTRRAAAKAEAVCGASTVRPAWSCPLCGTKAVKQLEESYSESSQRGNNRLLSVVSFKCCQTYVISSPPETLIWKEVWFI